MNHYTTEIQAINPLTGELTTYYGPNVPGISFSDAEDHCQRNGLGYCKVVRQLVSEIPRKEGEPDWKNRIDYDLRNN